MWLRGHVQFVYLFMCDRRCLLGTITAAFKSGRHEWKADKCVVHNIKDGRRVTTGIYLLSTMCSIKGNIA